MHEEHISNKVLQITFQTCKFYSNIDKHGDIHYIDLHSYTE